MGTFGRTAMRASILIGALASSLAAGDYSFPGTFASGDAIQFFDFSTSGGTTLYTLSYGGGTNAAGTPIPAGGFEPLLTLYDVEGDQIGYFQDSAAPAGGCQGPITAGANGCLDAYFNGSLAAGAYILALSQFTTTPNGSLSDGSTYDPTICFTSFCDSFDNVTPRTGNWALDIISADSASEVSAPEPDTLGLSGCVIMVLLFRQRAHRRAPSRFPSL